MPLLRPFLLFFLLLPSYPLLLPANPLPMEHEMRLSKHRLSSSGGPQVEHIAVGRPLPTAKLKPVYTMRVLSHGFGQTMGLPPVTTGYYGPNHCSWTRAVIEITGFCNGTQYDRIGAVWLSGVELIRTSTPQSTERGIVWKVQKDITRYDYLLRQWNITLTAMLENALDLDHYGVHWLDVSVLFYDVPHFKPKHPSLLLDEHPADLIIPICSSGENGYWFKILSGKDAVFQGIKIPKNTYRAVIEVYVSPHGDDDTWFANPPDTYLEMNGLPTKRGHGAYREVMVKLNNVVIGSIIPFPVMYGGTINPLFWVPLAGIKAFNFPTYEIELTPFLGMLLDGRTHYYGLSIADAISYWLANANIHLWLDKSGKPVLAGAIKYKDPSTCVERESEFEQLDGKFEIEGERESEWSGWVDSSLGNYTTHVQRKLEFENTIKLLNNGAEKEVKQEIKVGTKVRVTTRSGGSVTRLEVQAKYPLKYRLVDQDGANPDTRLLTTKLEHSLEAETEDPAYKSKLRDSQKCEGWIFVEGHDVVSGTARTEQKYKLDDRFGRYSRRVTADGGVIKGNASLLLRGTAEVQERD